MILTRVPCSNPRQGCQPKFTPFQANSSPFLLTQLQATPINATESFLHQTLLCAAQPVSSTHSFKERVYGGRALPSFCKDGHSHLNKTAHSLLKLSLSRPADMLHHYLLPIFLLVKLSLLKPLASSASDTARFMSVLPTSTFHQHHYPRPNSLSPIAASPECNLCLPLLKN